MFWMTLLLIPAVIILMVKILSRRNEKYSQLPPNQQKIPLFGNIHQLVASEKALYELFHDISKKIGSVFTFWFGRKPLVIVNSYDIAKKILHSKDFAGRPQRRTGKVMTNGFQGIIIADYCPVLTARRSIMKRNLKISDQECLEQTLREETDHFISSIYHKIDSDEHHTVFNPTKDIDLLIGNITWKLLFGKRFERHDTEFSSLLNMCLWLKKGIALVNCLDCVPILANLNIVEWLYIDKFCYTRDKIIKNEIEERSKEPMKHNRSLTSQLLNENLSRDSIVIILGDMMFAGFETVSSTLQFVVLYLIMYKYNTEICYKEVDHVIGLNELSIDDIDKFHYVKAFISETLRMRPVGPLAVPHKAITDSSILQYFIPKDTIVLINIYAIHHDGSIHKNPEIFNPERFLDENGCYQDIGGYLPFSSGRRECLGKHMAMKELIYITIKLLQNFQLSAENQSALSGKAATKSCIPVPRKYNVVFNRRNNK